MKLTIVTIMLDSMPFLQHHLSVFNRLKIPFEWIVISGVAEPVKCTSWCQRIPARFSHDGSHEFMEELARNHPRVKYFAQSHYWPGKVEMFNYALAQINEPCVLLQMDADECWTANQLETMVMAFERNPRRDSMFFKCRYFLGPRIIITSDDTYGNKPGEWLRAWNFTPGQRFKTHEPPWLEGSQTRPLLKHQTAAIGLVFDHYAYAFEQSVSFKQAYYNYPNAVEEWRRLQQNTVFPTRVGNFLSWVKDDAMCDVI